MTQHARNFEEQLAKEDADLFPGRMAAEHLDKMCKCYIMTAEFDIFRRDSIDFAKKMADRSKLAGFCDFAG